MEELVSPTYGTIEFIGDSDHVPKDEQENGVVAGLDRVMTINIHANSDHDIFSPLNGEISSFFLKNGIFKKDEFDSQNPHNGRLYITIKPNQTHQINQRIVVCLEIGKPEYNTNRIKINVTTYQSVQKGQQIGEILIGSTAYLYYSSQYYLQYYSVVGGLTPILSSIFNRYY